MQKKLCLALAVIFLLAFSGCGDGTADVTPTASIAPTDPPVTDAPPATSAPTPQATPTPEPSDEELVSVIDYIPSILVELKYASEDNFTGTVIYDFTDAYLRYGTVKKLAKVQEALSELGYSLKIWDAYRPQSAQFTLWEVYPDPVYVSNPNTGFSSHSRGNTVDVTLVMIDGSEIEMPTGFDDFSALADRDYSDVNETAKGNALILEDAMSEGGFNCYPGEWWHFSDNTEYPAIEN